MLSAYLIVIFPWSAVVLRTQESDSDDTQEAGLDGLASETYPEVLLSSHMELSSDEEFGTPGTKHEWVACQDFCVMCKTGDHAWQVRRATSALRKIGVGMLTIGSLSLAAAGLGGILATGTTAAWLAGVPVVFFKSGLGLGVAGGIAGGISTTGWMGIMAGTGAGYVLRDWLVGSRRCPDVAFSEIKRSKGSGRTGKGKKKRGPYYALEDIYFIELIDQMVVKPNNTANQIKVLTTDRDNMDENRRLQALMACSILTQSQQKFPFMGSQLPDIAKLTRKYGGVAEAVVAACGRWLCVETWPSKVYKPRWISRRGIGRC